MPVVVRNTIWRSFESDIVKHDEAGETRVEIPKEQDVGTALKRAEGRVIQCQID